MSFYGIGGYPGSYFDGLIGHSGAASYGAYLADYNTRHNIPTDVTIELTGMPVSGSTYTVRAAVGLEAGGAPKTARIYMVQVLDHWPTSPAYHRNGFKQAVATVDLTLIPGQKQTVERAFTFDGDSWANQDDIKIIAWAQAPLAAGPAEVYQSSTMTWPFPTGDCNENGIPDEEDIAAGTSQDCNDNFIPDECELEDNDCNSNGVPDECDRDLVLAASPVDAEVCPAGSVDLTVTAVNPATATYQWLRYGQVLTDGDGISGARTSTLTISDAIGTDAGKYSCKVTDGCLTFESDTAFLTVVVLPAAIVAQPQAVMLKCNGYTATFAIDSSGTLPHFEWRKNDVPLVADERISGVDTEVLTIVNVSPADSGTYTCFVYDLCGSEELSAPSQLDVVSPDFVLQPQDTCAELGTTAILSADAIVPPGQTIGWRWKKNGVSLTEGGHYSGTRTNTLTITNITAAEAGNYSALAYSSNPVCLTDSDIAVLTVGECAACSHPGDMDDDGDYDLADMQGFILCFGVDVTADADCACANVDDANDLVDVADWTAMEAIITGPM